jgi:transcriptional regulator with XRE-family HTH domain
MRRFTLRERSQLGDAVRRIRLRAGRSQGELAHLLGVSQSIVSEWEAGYRIPSKEALADLARSANQQDTDILNRASEKARRRRARAATGVTILPHAITLPQNGAEVNV